MVFSKMVAEPYLGDFVSNLRNKLRPNIQDVVTPAHIIFKQLEKRGNIKEEAPGLAPTQTVRIATPDRTITLSRSRDFQDIDRTPHAAKTVAEFNWIMLLTTLTIPTYEYHNTQGADAIGNYLKEKMDELDTQLHTRMCEQVWHGETSGNESIWGIADFVQFDPTVDPSRGPVGGIPVASVPTWANQAKNFNAPAITWDTGARMNTFLSHGTNSLLQLYLDCSNNAEASLPEGQPDLLLVNSAYFRYCNELVDAGLMFRDSQKSVEFGKDTFMFQNAAVVHDRDAPADPNNAAYGVGFLLNTKSWEWIWARGLKRNWGSMLKLQDKTGYSWDETSQATIRVKDRRRNGVHFGVQEPAQAA